MSSEGMKKRGWLSWDEVREGRWYWWWNEDPDSCPVPVSVSRSGHTGNDFFATPGQLGWNRHQDLSEMRGWWMPLIEPDPQSSDSTCSLTRQELIAENERLRKILAHVPGRIAIKAKEDAGFPNYIHAAGAFDETIGAVLGEKTKQ